MAQETRAPERRGKKRRRAEREAAQRAAGAGAPAAGGGSTPAALPAHDAAGASRRALVGLLAACAVAVLFCFWLRATRPAPWSYDEYYHLGVARQMWDGLRITSFRWTPFSVAYAHFADGSPLFHLLLMPFARLPLERAGLLGALLGQVFLVGALAWSLRALRAPGAAWFVLALPVLGPIVLQRLEMCRPQVWLAGFALLVVALLQLRRWKTLAVVTALFGLAHTAGWIAIVLAAIWSLAGVVARDADEAAAAPAAPWQPVAATALGWLAGQLVHPELPENFRTIWLSNFVIPFQSTAGADALLRGQLGTELDPPGAQIALGMWPAYVAAALVVLCLVRRPELRRRGTIAAALPALAFLFVGTFMARRFLELGAPLALLALAVVAAAGARAGIAGARWWRPAAGVAVVIAALGALGALADQGYGRVSPPLAMATWLGEHGKPGERVFTAQWADAAPLFYAAPQLQSLVALDPTAFWIHDADGFRRYAEAVDGHDPLAPRTVRERFGARWATIQAVPRYQAFANQLYHAGATIAFRDEDYLVLDLQPMRVAR